MLTFVALAVLGTGLLVFSVLFDDLLGDLVDLPFLSGTAIGGFCAAFGFAGMVALSATASTTVAAGVGAGAGVVVAGVAAALTGWLRRDTGSGAPSMATVVGRPGVVVSAIVPGKLGTVSVVEGSHTTRYSAHADEPLAVGAAVEVITALSSTAVVVRSAPTA